LPHLAIHTSGLSLARCSFRLYCTYVLVVLKVFTALAFQLPVVELTPGANPTIVSYNASAVKIYNARINIFRIENKNNFLYFEKCISLLHRWLCICKFRSRRIGSRFIFLSWFPAQKVNKKLSQNVWLSNILFLDTGKN
jgi:hypothetical protein